MSDYNDARFLNHLDIQTIRTVFEVGARYGDESLTLSRIFNASEVYSFECNPRTIDTCRDKLAHRKNIHFMAYGLGDVNESRPFYAYILNNDGASSFYKRIDYNDTQQEVGSITIRKLSDVVEEHAINTIDILCMDVQGYELNVLKGAGDFIRRIRYVIMEEPKAIANEEFLPKGVHSKYIHSPKAQEIAEFMTKNNFVEIQRIEENKIEDNVMYKNLLF